MFTEVKFRGLEGEVEKVRWRSRVALVAQTEKEKERERERV